MFSCPGGSDIARSGDRGVEIGQHTPDLTVEERAGVGQFDELRAHGLTAWGVSATYNAAHPDEPTRAAAAAVMLRP